MAALQDAEGAVELGENAGDGGLARAGITDQDGVEVEGIQDVAAQAAVVLDEVDQFVQLVLDVRHTDQGVQLPEGLGEHFIVDGDGRLSGLSGGYAGVHVSQGDLGDVLHAQVGELGRVVHHAQGHLDLDLLDEVVDVAGVAESLVAAAEGLDDDLLQTALGRGGEGDAVLPGGVLGNGVKFLRHEIAEVVVVLEAGLEAGVAVQQALHLVRVAGHDDGQVPLTARHFLDDDLDHLAAEILAVVVAARQGVGFVDEQDAAAGFLHHLPGFWGGLADVFSNEVYAVGHHGVALAEQAHLLVELPHHPRHGGLSRPGVATEDGVDVDALVHLEAPLLA